MALLRQLRRLPGTRSRPGSALLMEAESLVCPFSLHPPTPAVELELPMKVQAEDLGDGRKPLRALKAVTMGPFLMAGEAQRHQGTRGAKRAWV